MSIRALINSWKIFPVAWSILAAGFGFVLFSAIVEFEVPSSGALMICSVILAELVQRGHPLKQIAPAYNSKWLRHDYLKNSDSKGMVSVFDRMPRDVDQTANEAFFSDHNNLFYSALLKLNSIVDYTTYPPRVKTRRTWHFLTEFEKIEKPFSATAGIFAVLGSLIWAYGHLVWAN